MKHYALIGDPVGHSLSPAIYGFLFEKYGIDADFSLIRLPKGRAGDAVYMGRPGHVRRDTYGSPKAVPEYPCSRRDARIFCIRIPSVDKSTQALKACFGTLLRSRRLYYIQ